MKSIIRHSTYLFWNILQQFSVTGIPRLVLFPIVAYIVGKDDFGLFATAISFILIVGVHPADGLAMGLLRNLSHYQSCDQEQLVVTAVRMSRKFLFYFIFIGLIVLAAIAILGLIDKKTYLCLTFLSVSLYAENQMMLMLTPLRYKRLFKEYALWYAGDSFCVLILGIIGAYVGGIGGVAFGFMIAHWGMCWILKKRYYQPHLGDNPEQAKVLRSVWFHITIAGMLVLAGPHLNRIVLRIYSDNESVADLFAATGIAYVFVAPVSNFSALLLSMISRYKTTRDIAGSVLKKMIGLMTAGAILEMVLFYGIAPIAMKLLFPKFGDRAEGLFDILIWMIPASVIGAFVRPLLTKFAAVAWIPRINFFVLAVMLILMFSLIPRWGIVGAAWSISVGSIFDAILRLGVFAVVYKRSYPVDKAADPGRLPESASQGGVL